MHQLAVLSIGWATFFHLAKDGVHHNPSFLGFILGHFFPKPDLTPLPYSPSYLHQYCTNLGGTLLIIPYSHNYLNNYLSY
jgi:hypothetical protein